MRATGREHQHSRTYWLFGYVFSVVSFVLFLEMVYLTTCYYSYNTTVSITVQYAVFFKFFEASRGLISKGKVMGTVDLIGSQKVDAAWLESNIDKHQVKDLLNLKTKATHAWEFCDPVRFEQPLMYLPKRGSQMWMTLVYPKMAQTISDMQKSAELMSSKEDLAMVAANCDIPDLKFKTTRFFRVLRKQHGLNQKFYYKPDLEGDMKRALLCAFACLHRYAVQHDMVSCMTVPDLRSGLTSCGASFSGKDSQEKLRDLYLKHMVESAEPVTDMPDPSMQSKLQASQKDDPPVDAAGEAEQEKGFGEPDPNKSPEKRMGEMSCEFFVPPSVVVLRKYWN